MTIYGLAPSFQGRIVLPCSARSARPRYVDQVQVRLVSGRSAAQVADVADNLGHRFVPSCAAFGQLSRVRCCWSSSAATPSPRWSRPHPSGPTPTCGHWKSAAAKTASHGWSASTAPTS